MTHPVSFIITSHDHAIAIGYRPNEKTWFYCNYSAPIELHGTNVLLLADHIMQAFRQSPEVALHANVITATSQAPAIKQIVAGETQKIMPTLTKKQAAVFMRGLDKAVGRPELFKQILKKAPWFGNNLLTWICGLGAAASIASLSLSVITGGAAIIPAIISGAASIAFYLAIHWVVTRWIHAQSSRDTKKLHSVIAETNSTHIIHKNIGKPPQTRSQPSKSSTPAANDPQMAATSTARPLNDEQRPAKTPSPRYDAPRI
jgi:hypothetical protein